MRIGSFRKKVLLALQNREIYLDLIKSSNSMTDVEAKKQYHLENDNVNIKYALIPYDIIEDSLVDINDNEINKYIRDNKKNYKKDKTTNIRYVIFEEKPTEADLLEIRSKLEVLKKRQVVYNDISKLTDTIGGFKEILNNREFIEQYSEVLLIQYINHVGDSIMNMLTSYLA